MSILICSQPHNSHCEFSHPRPLNKPSYWRMCLGKHHMNSSMDVPSEEECYAVDGIIRHEGFVYESDRSDISNDIALVHLAEPVNMTNAISPVCLPKPGDVMAAGTHCFVTGWGDEKGRVNFLNVLKGCDKEEHFCISQ